MSAHDVTPAVRRAAEAMEDAAFRLIGRDLGTIYRDRIARETLAAALDVEEMARVLHREGAWCGVCEYDGWDACKECRETVTGYAAALRAAILGGCGMSPEDVPAELVEAAARKEEPYLVEWATEVDTLGTQEIWDSEEYARELAKRYGQRLFRVEWTEVDRDA
jgi:GAF domain-containing protein